VKPFIKKTSLLLGAIVLILIGTVLYRALTFRSMQITPEERVLPEVNLERAVAALSSALQLETLSSRDPSEMDPGVFQALHVLLEERFPLVHQKLRKERIGGLSLLYQWPGTDSSQKAIVFLAHQDVVPAPEGDAWIRPPFGGEVADGYVWGRGAMDDKGSLIAILEAVESLLEQGFQPGRDIYCCFGHDEEVGGYKGAAVIAATLAERGVKAEFTLDEGLVIVGGDMFGVDRDIALVALTEKGYLSLELKTESEPGHSSTPPRETAIGALATAVTRVAESPMSARMTDPVRHMFRYLGPEISFPMRAFFANLWLTRPLLLKQLAGSRTTDAAIRTTTAFTIIEGGHTENVLPAEARAVVNYRLLPGDTVEAVTERTRRLVNDDRVAITPTCEAYPSPDPSQVDGPAFATVHTAIRAVFPEVIVAPGLMLGGSDSHHYHVVTDNIYGFLPLRMSQEDLERMHGPNERLGIEDFSRMIMFYATLMETTAG